MRFPKFRETVNYNLLLQFAKKYDIIILSKLGEKLEEIVIKKLVVIALLLAAALLAVACNEIENTDIATDETEKKEEEVSPCKVHSYGAWSVIKDPTCGDKGTEKQECSVCGNTATRSIDPIGEHTFMSTGNCKICSVPMSKDFLFSLNEDGQSYSFNYSGNDKGVTVPATFNEKPVTKLSADCFYFCTELETVTLPDSITEFGTDAFKYCQKLTRINVPASLSVIKSGAFYACTSLSSFVIPQAVTRIESDTFYSTNLSSITIPNSVTYIGPRAFQGSELRTLTIPANVTEIGTGAFSSCRKLISITIAEGTKLKEIPASAFEAMVSLKTVKIAEGVETIHDYAFKSSPFLYRVELPSTIRTIGKEAFSYTGLDNVTISYNGSEAQWALIRFGINWDKSMFGKIMEYKE